MALGVSPDRIVYAHPCKPPKQIRWSATHGVNLTTFDTESELQKVRGCVLEQEGGSLVAELQVQFQPGVKSCQLTSLLYPTHFRTTDGPVPPHQRPAAAHPRRRPGRPLPAGQQGGECGFKLPCRGCSICTAARALLHNACLSRAPNSPKSSIYCAPHPAALALAAHAFSTSC